MPIKHIKTKAAIGIFLTVLVIIMIGKKSPTEGGKFRGKSYGQLCNYYGQLICWPVRPPTPSEWCRKFHNPIFCIPGWKKLFPPEIVPNNW